MIDHHKQEWRRAVKEGHLEPIIWGCIMGIALAYVLVEFI